MRDGSAQRCQGDRSGWAARLLRKVRLRDPASASAPPPVVNDKLVIITGDMTADTIKERLGRSPLADSVMDSVQFGAARVYCLPVAASTAGTVGEVEKEGKAAARSRRPAAPITPLRWW